MTTGCSGLHQSSISDTGTTAQSQTLTSNWFEMARFSSTGRFLWKPRLHESV